MKKNDKKKRVFGKNFQIAITRIEFYETNNFLACIDSILTKIYDDNEKSTLFLIFHSKKFD